MNEPSVHKAAADGYTRGADIYVRGRPDYPPQVTQWLADTLALAPGKTVLELGAGTGKFTPRLIQTGARVIVVEPVQAMLDKLTATYPGVEAHQGTAQAIPLPDASVDGVVCAQAFHWFAHHAALAEIHRVLKPGGRLGLIWNLRDARVPWVAELDARVNRWEGDAPRFYTGAWRAAFPFDGFGPLQAQTFSQLHTGPVEDVIFNRVRSTSFVSALAPADREKLEARVRELVASEPALNHGGDVSVPYITSAFVAEKLGLSIAAVTAT